MHDLLTDSMFTWTDLHEQSHRGSLPELYAALVDPESAPIIGFDRLQAHQQHPWHAFLVQIAAMILHRADVPAPGPADGSWWRDRLLDLADGIEEAWQLVVEDLSRPAFMQSPVPEGSISGWPKTTQSPDRFDVLATAKNFDVKLARANKAAPEQWVYSLISLQTQQSYFVKNCGVTRMRGKTGDRNYIRTASSKLPGIEILRDFHRCLDSYETIVDDFGWKDNGIAIPWVFPWDGKSSTPMNMCDPLVVEICRRIRTFRMGDRLTASFVGAACERISPAIKLNGNLGDPWTPIVRGGERDGQALALTASGFDYRKTADLLNPGTYAPPSCGSFDKAARYWSGAALIRDRREYKTKGYHERWINLPRRITRILRSNPGIHEQIGSRTRTMIEDAKSMRKHILKPALLALAQPERDPSNLKWDDAHGDDELGVFEGQVDGVFFDHLWEHLEELDDRARRSWQQQLVDFGRHRLEHAIARMRTHATHRYRAIVAAEGLFHGGCRKHYHALYAEEETTA